MLGQIERKTSTPSITTLWKIASGLKVSFTELTQESDAIINKITLDQTQALSSEHNKYQIFSIFKFDIERKIESFMAVIEPSGKSVSPHGAGSMKYITVYDGTVTITLDGESSFYSSMNLLNLMAICFINITMNIMKPHGYISLYIINLRNDGMK